MPSEHYLQVFVEGKGDSDEYTVTGVKKGGEREEWTAGALNLNGYAMATSGLEIGEYGQTVLIHQEEGSRYLNIIVDENGADGDYV